MSESHKQKRSELPSSDDHEPSRYYYDDSTGYEIFSEDSDEEDLSESVTEDSNCDSVSEAEPSARSGE